MANNYYNFPTAFVAGTKVRSDQVNSEYSGIESAFDKLPTTPSSLITGKSWFGVDVQGATVNEYLITTEDTISPLENGQRVAFFATHTNDGDVTFNVNSTGLVAAVDNDGSALATDAIINGQYYEFVYDNTNTQWRRSLASSQSVPGGVQYSIQYNDPLDTFAGTADFLFDGDELVFRKSGVSVFETRANELNAFSEDPGDPSLGDDITVAVTVQSADNEIYGSLGFDSGTELQIRNQVFGAETRVYGLDAGGSEGIILTMKADEAEVAFLEDFNTPVRIEGDTGSLGTDNGALIVENDATLYMAETSNQIDVAGYGQLYVNDSFSPARLFWRNDSGTEFDLTLVGGSTTPGGADGEVQYNNGGAFGGMGDALQFNDSNNRITMGASIAGSGTQLVIDPDVTTGFYVNIIDNAETLTSGTMLSVGTESNSASGNIVTIDAISVNNTATPLRVYQGANTDQVGINLEGFTTGSPRMDFTQLGTERARLQYLDSTDEFTISSTEIAMLGFAYVRNTSGILYCQDSNTAGGNAQATVGFRDSASANLGSVGFSNGDGNMRITVGNLSGGNIELRPQSGDVELYDAGTAVARTLSAVTGGLEVNNTLTGAGFERVLTTSDLGGGIGGSIAEDQIAFGSSTANEIEGDNDFTWDGNEFSMFPGTGGDNIRLITDNPGILMESSGNINNARITGDFDDITPADDRAIRFSINGGDKVSFQTNDLFFERPLFIAERAAARGNQTGYGQLWVNQADDSLNYTTEAGVNTDLTAGSPGGSDTQLQYNDGGAFGGMAEWAYDDAAQVLTVTSDNTGSVSASPFQMVCDDLTAGNAIRISVGAAGNLSTGGGMSIIGESGGGSNDFGAMLDVITRNASPAIRAWSQDAATPAARLYSNESSRTAPVLFVENDAPTGNGVGIEIQNDQSGPHIELTGNNGEGIKFTNLDFSTDPNTLDYYDEGTFTPYLDDNILGDGQSDGQTYGLRTGRYTRIGRMVFFDIRLTMTSIGSLSGDVYVVFDGTLPNNTAEPGPAPLSVSNVSGFNISAGESVAAAYSGVNGAIELRLFDAATGDTALQASEVSNNGQLYISGHYFVNSQ